jgi:hypothetical protein
MSKSKDNLFELSYQKITSKKFRRNALGDQAKSRIERAVWSAVETGKKIEIVSLIGGYKHFNVPSSPNCDWAEIFTFYNFLAYAKEIAEVYPHGVRLTWRIDPPAIVSKIVGQDIDSLKKYHQSFGQLLEEFVNEYKKELEDNNIELTSSLSWSEEEVPSLYPLINKKIIDIWNDFKCLNSCEKDQLLDKAERNCYIATHLTDEFLPSDVHHCCHTTKTYLYHDAYRLADLEYADKYFDDKIIIVNRKSNDHYMFCSSVKTTGIQFWVGSGAISSDKQSYTIVSHSQLQTGNYKFKYCSPTSYGLPAFFESVPSIV